MSDAIGLPRVEYEHINSGQGTLNKNLYEKNSTKQGVLFQENDVLFGKLRPYLKNWLLSDFSGIAVGDFWVLRGDETDGSYIYSLIQSRAFDEVANQSTGTKMPRADWNLVSNTMFAVPQSRQEQQQIGTFLLNLDNLITLHQRKLDMLKKMKRSYLQQMFPRNDESVPRLRFADFEGEWEQRKLREVVERVTRKNKKLESTLPLTISAKYGLVDQEKFFNQKIASKNLSGYYLLKKGEFAYNKSYSNDYPLGTIKRLDNYEMGVLSTLYIVFKPVEVKSDFLVSYYDTNNWHKEVSMRASEGARNHGLLNITAQDFLDTKLKIPKFKEEQNKIGTFFKKLDNSITLNQTKLDKLNLLKKTYLQKMFI